MKGALLMLILACVVPAKGADPSNRTLSTDQAKALVLAALSSAQRRLPKLEVRPDEGQSSPRFMFFTVSWEGLPDGSVIVGNYAVDPIRQTCLVPQSHAMKRRMQSSKRSKRI